jgi:hypothetical protein
MIIVPDVLPVCKRFLRPLALYGQARLLLTRLIAAFVLHPGRMSCMQAAGAIRSQARHRAQIGRFVARSSWRGRYNSLTLRKRLIRSECQLGQWIYIVDATLNGQAGKKTENTYSTGNRKRRPAKGRRYNKYKHARKSCHCFTTGLLISPSGRRIPFCKPYYTRQYCAQYGLQHRTTAEAAADLIGELPLPPEAKLVVLGDTAYDASVVHKACQARGATWIVPCNSERVLEGPQGQRPKVRSLLKNWLTWSRHIIRLAPGQGKYAAYRRLSPHRVGPKAKPRTYDVHQERRRVRSVGEVEIVFSTTNTKLAKATPDDVKILMTNNLELTARQIVELYALRWQIELFFKEIKSVLGFHQYRFRRFAAVEGWVEATLTTFLYLEWYRTEQLRRRALDEEAKRWWQHQRTYGLCQAVRQASEAAQLKYLADHLHTPRGITELKRVLRAGFPQEYQAKL